MTEFNQKNSSRYFPWNINNSEYPVSPENISAYHDARTGFHDITPIPEFHPSLISLQIMIIIAIILALLSLVIIIKKDEKILDVHPPAPDPYQIALEQLEGIRQRHSCCTLNLRELAAQISLTLRIYYNDAYGFPADDRTEQEIKNELLTLLPKKIPALAKEAYSSLIADTSAILSQCEFIAFSDIAEEEYRTNNALFIQIIEDTIKLVKQLNKHIKNEKERIKSMTESNLENYPTVQ